MATHDWIICHDSSKGDDAYAMECLRCGYKQRFATPISIEVYIAAGKAFQKQHAKCRALPILTTVLTKDSTPPILH